QNYSWLAKDLPPTDAEKVYYEAIAIQEKLLADFPSVKDYRHDLVRSFHELGGVLNATGKIREAETAYRQALAIGEPLLAIPKIDYYRTRPALIHSNLGDLLMQSKRFHEAEQEYRQSIALYENL